MARLKPGDNLILNELRGQIGKTIVVKQYGNRIVVSKFPDMSRVKRTKKQVTEQSKFQQAVNFARRILADPKKKKEFAKKLKKGQSVYHAAISAYLKGEVGK